MNTHGQALPPPRNVILRMYRVRLASSCPHNSEDIRVGKDAGKLDSFGTPISGTLVHPSFGFENVSIVSPYRRGTVRCRKSKIYRSAFGYQNVVHFHSCGIVYRKRQRHDTIFTSPKNSNNQRKRTRRRRCLR